MLTVLLKILSGLWKDRGSFFSRLPAMAGCYWRKPSRGFGQFMSLHLIEDVYFDVVFHSWTCCGDGGGFSCTRIPIENDGELLNGSLSGEFIYHLIVLLWKVLISSQLQKIIHILPILTATA